MCKGCGYEFKELLGSSNLDQVLTDVNLDYVEYHLFICTKESKFVHANIHDNDFEGKCPSDGSELIEISEIPPIKCPRCNQEGLVTKISNPLEQSGTAKSNNSSTWHSYILNTHKARILSNAVSTHIVIARWMAMFSNLEKS